VGEDGLRRWCKRDGPVAGFVNHAEITGLHASLHANAHASAAARHAHDPADSTFDDCIPINAVLSCHPDRNAIAPIKVAIKVAIEVAIKVAIEIANQEVASEVGCQEEEKLR